MSLSARNWAWDVETITAEGKERRLLVGEKATLLCLAEHENTDLGYAFPSQSLIARKTGLVERSVRRHIITLAAVKAIVITKKRSREGKWLSNVYVLNVPASYRTKDKAWLAARATDY